ncbi:MAG: hypothetical protein SFY96_10495 [Planctomycetota bacterium]|nr:hypothetical protein [Planctomycetota bacterium]
MIARQGDPAPGLPGKFFNGIISEGPSIGPSGHVAFRSDLNGESNYYSLWCGLPGALGLVARAYAQAPGFPAGVNLDVPRAPVGIDPQGRVGFYANLWGNAVPTSQWATFWGGPGGVTPLLRQGAEVPWVTSGVLASSYFQPPLLGGGTAVLSASTTSNNSNGSVGIWQTTPSGLQLIMRQGASAPGMPVGAVFYGTGLPSRPLVNSSGDVAFWAQVTGGGVDYLTNDRGIWIRRNGVLSLAFRGNAPVSGFGTGVTLIYPDLRAFAIDGSIAFFGDLKFNNGQNNQSALWWGKPGDYRLVARLGAQAAGAPVGVVHGSFTFTRPMLAGEFMGFTSSLFGPGVNSSNSDAFFLGRRDNVRMVIRQGDQVPGMPSGVVFASIYDGFAMNARGQIVFRATIAGPGITTANDEGIWATDSRGHIVQVARQGTPITAMTANGTSVSLPVVLLSILADSGGEDGTPTSINAAGQVAFYVYTDPAQASSQAAIIRADIIEPCVADFNEDGFLDFADFDDFVGAFEGGLATSDINADGFLTFDDFDAFVAAFEAGC